MGAGLYYGSYASGLKKFLNFQVFFSGGVKEKIVTRVRERIELDKNSHSEMFLFVKKVFLMLKK